MPVLGKRSLDTLKGIHPDLQKVIKEAIKESPVDFTVTDGVRTTAQQQALYAKGRTAPGGKVTNADGVKNKSNHQVKADGYGYAIDLYPYVDGKVDYNDESDSLKVIAAHIKATAKCLGINVGWGGEFKSILDKPHFELKK